jgi:hypothetical protein
VCAWRRTGAQVVDGQAGARATRVNGCGRARRTRLDAWRGGERVAGARTHKRRAGARQAYRCGFCDVQRSRVLLGVSPELV